ncbi:hypothetical protein [Spirillospora sp. NPDC047279]|uniref:hypothetical protein n=1 Tax=Spirillospora sp. NPDC047279 TaxID=3155478 RepID=UPI0033CED869
MQCPTCGTNTPATLGRCAHCNAPVDQQLASMQSGLPTPPMGAPVAEAEAFGDRTMMVPPPTPAWAPSPESLGGTPAAAAGLPPEADALSPMGRAPSPMTGGSPAGGTPPVAGGSSPLGGMSLPPPPEPSSPLPPPPPAGDPSPAASGGFPAASGALPPADGESTAAWTFDPNADDDDPGSGGHGGISGSNGNGAQAGSFAASPPPPAPSWADGPNGLSAPSPYAKEQPAESIVPESWYAPVRPPREQEDPGDRTQIYSSPPPAEQPAMNGNATMLDQGMPHPGGPYPPPPGPGMDQYGADQYGADQYGADQYGADQYGMSRQVMDPNGMGPYGMNQQGSDQQGFDQHGTAPYGDPQGMGGPHGMGPNGMGPNGMGPNGYGPGGPVDANGMPIDPAYGGQMPPRSGGGASKALIIGVAALVVVALVAVVLVVLPGDDDKPPTAKPSASAPPTTKVSGEKPLSGPVKQQAAAVNALLNESAGTKRVLTAAMTQVGKCDTLPAAMGGFQKVAQARQSQLRRTQALKLDELPRGESLRTYLRMSFQGSLEADLALMRWAQGASRKCKGKPKPPASRAPGLASGERKATLGKRQFVKVWNPIAKKAGHPQRRWTGI